jgi:hypothetical protein
MRIQLLEIPSEEQGMLASLVRLSGQSLGELESALRDVKPTLDKEALVSQLRENPNLATVSDLAGIVASLINIAGTAYSAGVDTDDVIDAAIQTIKNDDVLELTDEDAETLKVRLSGLEKLEAVGLIAKASELLKSNERTFHSVRIVSDLRPICLGEEAKIAGAVIVHQLAVRASRNGRREVIYFALDSTDLTEFNEVIFRAIKKDKALRELAVCSKAPVLSPPVE